LAGVEPVTVEEKIPSESFEVSVPESVEQAQTVKKRELSKRKMMSDSTADRKNPDYI